MSLRALAQLTGVPGELGRALTRPGTYAGYAKEALSLAAGAAAFPLGLLAPHLLPLALLAPSDVTPPPRRAGPETAPIMLVHGYGHNRSAWRHLSRALHEAGFSAIETLDYNPLREGVPEVAARLRAMVDDVLRRTGSSRVDLVGHSMGGIVCRWMVQECDGWDVTGTCVTVASPHRGTVAAHLGWGRTARQLRPRSAVLRRLDATLRPSAVRWVAYYSNIDVLVVPQSSAKLTHPAAATTNVLLKDLGHMGVLFSSRLAADVTSRLADQQHGDDEHYEGNEHHRGHHHPTGVGGVGLDRPAG